MHDGQSIGWLVGCTHQITAQLVNGGSDYGTEFSLVGEWGTVCDVGWSSADAGV